MHMAVDIMIEMALLYGSLSQEVARRAYQVVVPPRQVRGAPTNEVACGEGPAYENVAWHLVGLLAC